MSAAMQNMAEKLQLKENYNLSSNLTDICFTDCINDFTSRVLSGKEETCLSRCTEKFLKHTLRVNIRIMEQAQNIQQPSE
ncbi:Tim10/DDP family zinc finger protein [Chytridium lagenaria]|nr:Tim10/DDP family zinc finger protein [Chytridium lagenaria]